MKNRRSLTPSPTPSPGALAESVHATRRGDARHEVGSRVTLRSGAGTLLEGWALNVSRGGVRVILEEKVELGSEFEITLKTGAEESTDAVEARFGRIVWLQEEPDGVVAGIEFRLPTQAYKTHPGAPGGVLSS